MSDHQREATSTHIDKRFFFCDTCDNALWPCPTRILQDLIEELREGHPTFGDEPPLWVKTALYAAEARLREVGSDE